MWSLKVHPRPLRHKFRRVLGGAIVPAVIVLCFYAWQFEDRPYDDALTPWTFKKVPETAASGSEDAMPTAPANMSAEEIGRHNFETMLRSFFSERAERAWAKAAQGG
jgi:hypothetical protein